jgi:hypothetical protein
MGYRTDGEDPIVGGGLKWLLTRGGSVELFGRLDVADFLDDLLVSLGNVLGLPVLGPWPAARTTGPKPKSNRGHWHQRRSCGPLHQLNPIV